MSSAGACCLGSDSACHSCPYSSHRAEHPIFVYLISDKRFRADKGQQQLIPFVLMHENPFDDIRRQNRERGYTGANHQTKSGEGHMQIEMFIGPFSLDTAVQVQKMWRAMGRKLVQRVVVGLQLARQFKSHAVCRDVEWVKQLPQQQPLT